MTSNPASCKDFAHVFYSIPAAERKTKGTHSQRKRSVALFSRLGRFGECLGNALADVWKLQFFQFFGCVFLGAACPHYHRRDLLCVFAKRRRVGIRLHTKVLCFGLGGLCSMLSCLYTNNGYSISIFEKLWLLFHEFVRCFGRRNICYYTLLANRQTYSRHDKK